jgi:hypothetical protein
MDRRDVCVVRFPLGTNGAALRFGWRSEYGDVPPQMDILLQLVVDQVFGALALRESALTRQVVSVESRPAEAIKHATT